MPLPALVLALSLMAADTPPPSGEPLPAGAPTEAYPLTAWCYGALSEYLDIYDRVKPDLVTIDKMFGTSEPHEKAPYASDMAAARRELRMIASAVQAAEQASDSPIAPQGVAAIDQGRSIWRPAEMHTRRELARAWLTWALPDACDSTARELKAKSALLGQALKYNNPSAVESPPPQSPAPDAPAPDTAPPPAAAPDAAPPPAAPSDADTPPPAAAPPPDAATPPPPS